MLDKYRAINQQYVLLESGRSLGELQRVGLNYNITLFSGVMAQLLPEERELLVGDILLLSRLREDIEGQLGSIERFQVVAQVRELEEYADRLFGLRRVQRTALEEARRGYTELKRNKEISILRIREDSDRKIGEMRRAFEERDKYARRMIVTGERNEVALRRELNLLEEPRTRNVRVELLGELHELNLLDNWYRRVLNIGLGGELVPIREPIYRAGDDFIIEGLGGSFLSERLNAEVSTHNSKIKLI